MWETVRDALPEYRMSGPRLRALYVIDQLIGAVQQIVTRSPEDPGYLQAVEEVDRLFGAMLRRDPETHATIGLIARVRVRVLELLGRDVPAAPPAFFEGLWPEHPIDPVTFERAVNAWVAAESGKRVDVWGPVAKAVAAAGLARRAPASLKREWLAWQRQHRSIR